MKKLLWTSAVALTAVACLTACDDSSSGASNSIPSYKTEAALPDSCEMEVAKAGDTYFAANPRQIVLAANLAMIISQFSIGSIIHRRRTGIDEVFISVSKLCLMQVAIMFVSVRILGESGGMFQFMGLFLITESAIIFFVRMVEKYLIRLFRQAGRNTRSVLFVGNDPSILMLYRSLISDSSTGYKVGAPSRTTSHAPCCNPAKWTSPPSMNCSAVCRTMKTNKSSS